jgi:hypothetical protein
VRLPARDLAGGLLDARKAATTGQCHRARRGQARGIAVQLAYRGTFSIGPPFSTLPPFTLLDDGTLIGVAERSPVHTTTLSRDEVAKII